MKNLIGHSPAIQEVRKKIRELSRNRKNVIISGEQGVGKRLVAENIHLQSKDASKPYATLNLSMIDHLKFRDIADRFLSKREFSNPSTSEHGNFELPDGAILILEDIDKASAAVQGILTDLLTNIRRAKFGIRFALLFGKDLRERTKTKAIVAQLVQEVKNWEKIHISPLRDRREDIPELIEEFVRDAGRQHGIDEVVIDINALGVLVRKEWPGNAEELKSFVEQTVTRSKDKTIFALPEEMIDERSELTRMLQKIDQGVDFAIDSSMEIIEKRILERVLMKFEFNQSRTAKFLKIREDTLRYRMKKLGIASPQKI